MIRLTRETLEDLPANLSREGIETHASAASPLDLFAQHARYHGLLVAATKLQEAAS